MELPHLGKHCSSPNCNKLDFLPIKCDVCSEIFCDEHHSYTRHNCRDAYKKNNQVPVCPLCNIPIPIGFGQSPDGVVGAHIDTDCQSDPAKNKRKVFTNKCSLKGCKTKEFVRLVCTECQTNYCLKHRHPQDHQCQGKRGRDLSRFENKNTNTRNSPTSEDEILARALALSMEDANDASTGGMSQEEMDLALARQLQASEYQTTTTTTTTTRVGGSSDRSKCTVS